MPGGWNYQFQFLHTYNRTRIPTGRGIEKWQSRDTWWGAASLERDSFDKTPTVSTRVDNALGRDWDRLMAAAHVGDVNAYKILLSELAVWLRRYYARRLPPEMTEDAVQDVLHAIHEKRHTYDPAYSLKPWLAAIARYKWTHRLRSLKSEAANPHGENPGIHHHGDGFISGSKFRQPSAELKPPQTEVVQPEKRESHGIAEASRTTRQLILLIKVNFRRGLKRLADIIKATADAI